jgi:MFS transporter, AAHS family, 4-hydroxybenzoate transporter
VRSEVEVAASANRIGLWQIAIVGIVLITLFVDGLDVQLLALVAPLILKEWAVERAAFGPAMSAALIGMALGATFGGWLGDRYGRKPTLVLATVLFGAATIAAASARSVAAMTVLRIIGGIGFGAAAPCALALCCEWMPARVRSRVVSLVSIGTPLGGLIGAASLPALLPSLGWKGCFALCGAISMALAVVVLVFVPESPAYLDAKGRRTDVAATRVTATESIFTRANLRLNAGAWSSFVGIAFVSYGFIAWLPVFLTQSGFTLPQALQASQAFNLCAVAAAIASGFLITRMGSRQLIPLCCMAVLVCVVIVALALHGKDVGNSASSRWLVVLVSGGAGGFLGAATASIYAVLVSAYPATCRATGVGMGLAMGRAGAIASTYSGGMLLSLDGSSTRPFFLALGLCAVLALLGSLIIDRHILRTPGN